MGMIPEFKIRLTNVTPNSRVLMREWCEKNVGERWETRRRFDGSVDTQGKWASYWEGPEFDYGTAHTFSFMEHKDAVAFSLRWE